MVWFCQKHRMHSIDEDCPGCAREPSVGSLSAQLISGFYEEEKPHFRQGAPKHELEELVTADEVTGYVERIAELKAVNDDLVETLADVEDSEETLLRLLSVMVEHHDEACRYDHHGYCQAHFLEEECTVAEARKILDNMRKGVIR